MRKAKTSEFRDDPDNTEFNELLTRLGSFGVTQREVADLLDVSTGQVSRVKNGERHASVKHVRKMRKHVKELIDARNAEPTLRPSSLSNTPFGMTHASLRALSPTESVLAFRDLLWAMAASRGIPTTRISVPSNVFAADGGIDASILNGPGDPIAADDLLTAGTRFQIKTGDFAPWQKNQADTELFGRGRSQKFENLGSEIQNALRRGDRIVFVCFGKDPLDGELRKAVRNFSNAFQECGFPDAAVEVWGQTQLIGLFEEFPSLCLRLRGHVYQGFRSHAVWCDDQDMKPTVRYGAEQYQLVNDLRDGLYSGATPHIRLIGEPGVGKTRLALEVTNGDSLRSATLYVRDGRSLLQSSFFNELLELDNRRFVVLVIDECPSRDLAEIWNQLKSRADRIRLITIDHGPNEAIDDMTKVVDVRPVDDDQIVRILSDHGVTEYDAKRWADYCQGCPRVAHVLGVNLSARATNILASPSITEVWRRFIDGYDDPDSVKVQIRKIVLQCVSLFERFGFEEPVADEAKFIQRLAEGFDQSITPLAFRTAICELKDRRIIQGTTTLYLTPRLLHVHLYREFWRVSGSDFDITTTLKTMPPALRNWFVAMLRYAHDVKPAEKAVERLLGPAGIFSTGSFPDTQDFGRMVNSIAEACPKQTLHCLDRTIGQMDIVELQRIKESRQWLVWALEKIAVSEDCFPRAAELLLDLAEAENTNYDNNSTGTFVGLFSLVPGWAPTQAPPDVRLDCLTTVLDSESRERRLIGLRACRSALETRPAGRTVGAEHQGLRPTIPFWMPATYGELWDAYQDVWNLLIERLDVWVGEDRRALISEIIKASWSMLHIPPLTKSAVATIRAIALDNDTDVTAIIDLTRRQLRHRNSDLPEETKTELLSICELLNGHDFPSRLRRFVKYVSFEDYHDDDDNDSRLVNDQLDELAKSVAENPPLIIPELGWLVREESSPAYCFAIRLGKGDTNRKMLPSILEHQSAAGESGATSFLSGYLRAVFEHDISEWESILEGIAGTPDTAGKFSDFVVSSGMSNRMAKAVIAQCRRGAQSKERLTRWWFDSQVESLEKEVVNEMLTLQLEDGIGTLWGNAVRMCHSYYVQRNGESKPLPEDLVFQLLTSDALTDERVLYRAAYYWSRLARAFLDEFPERKWDLFEHILRVAIKKWSVLDDLDTNKEQILTSLLKENPASAWECIARVYECAGNDSTFGLQHWLCSAGHRTIGEEWPGPIQHVPPEILFDWAAQEPKDRGYWLTRVL
ncbi:MAG: helix-turn-helix domain-containing protein, partial [Rhodopirellula sp.]|nr:helix-turn-helix domain-containing protein [Rhodopirellula sp.]